MTWQEVLKNKNEKRRRAFAQRQGLSNSSAYRSGLMRQRTARNKGRYMPEPPTFLRPTIPKKEPKPKREIPKRNLIQNYFEMYQNKGMGKPTIDDIQREEGRPLTVDEINIHNKLLNE